MVSKNELPWIEAGYELFAAQGPDGLRVETLARKVGISKSSFYHHFADIDVFTERLLEWHLDRAVEIAGRARDCRTFDPDFLHLLAEYPGDLLFNRQLRVHRENLSYQLCFTRANAFVEDAILPCWSAELGLAGKPELARSLFAVINDMFYQRVTRENLHYAWMKQLLGEIKAILTDMIRGSGMGNELI